MNDSRPTSAVLVVLAMLAALFVALQPKPAAPTALPAERKAEENDNPDADNSTDTNSPPAGPLKPVYDFIGLGKGPVDRNLTREQTASQTANRLSAWPATQLGGCSFRFLIATVPDPLDSGFPSMFDHVVEALQRALSVDQFVIDRAWLPWQAKSKKEAVRIHEQHPGLILFRSTENSEGKQRLLALLLVGETPTAGIHKAAFAKAVQLIGDCPRAAKEEGNRVRVIGPYFSGSALSLRLALESAQKVARKGGTEEPAVKVVCGSATGFEATQFRSAKWARDGKEPAFETTILPDRLVLKYLWRYLGNPGKPLEAEKPMPIVVLREANTGFGMDIKDTLKNSCGCTTPGAKPQEGPEFIQVPFPLHISQLRARYTRDQLARFEKQGLPRSGRNLPFPIEVGKEQNEDVLRAEAPLMTAATNDLVLNNLVLVMAQKRARHVCLISSDPQDTIFLARVIRDRYPDVQLVTIGPNLLYTHEDYNSALRGTIVAGTYPLFPGVQRWSDLSGNPSPTRILFSDQSFQGTYNAALVHLAGGPQAKPDEVRGRMLDYGWEGEKGGQYTLPPIWISVVGSNGQLVPVTHVPPREYLKAEESNERDQMQFVYRRPLPEGEVASLRQVNFPGAWLLVFLSFLGVNVYFFYHAIRYFRDTTWTDEPGELCCLYKQRIDLGVMCLAQVLLYGLVAILAWVPLSGALSGWFSPAGGVLLLSLAMLAVSCAVYLHAQTRSSAGWPLRQRWEQYASMTRKSERIRGCPAWLGAFSQSGFWVALADVLMFLLLTLTLVCFLWRIGVAAWHSRSNPVADDVIHFDRLVHLGNGVTPALPRLLFCAALIGWSFCLVKKLFLANRCAVPAPFPDDTPGLAGLRAVDAEVRSELMPPSTLRNHFAECAGLFAVTVLLFWWLWADSIPPLDGWWHGLITLVGFCLGGLLMSFTLLQFYFAWRALKKLLRLLTLLPMQPAFQRLHEKVVATFGNYLFSLRPRHSHLSVSVQQFHRLEHLLPAFRQAMEQANANHASLGLLDEAAVALACKDFEAAFPPGTVGPCVADHFRQEFHPDSETDMTPPPGTQTSVHNWGGLTGEDCSLLANRCLRVLRHFWPRLSLDDAFGRATPPDKPPPAPSYLSLPEGHPVRDWAMAAEDFCAIEITRYLSQFVVQLRTLITSMSIGALLLLVAATVYPFFPQQQLLLFLIVLSGFTAGAIVTFLVQLNRDELISRINRTAPNRFTPDLSFLQGAITYVLPIVAGVVVQFPVVTSTIRSLLDPLFHILK